MTASVDGRALYVVGVIGPRFERDVRKALRRHRGIRELVIESPGGLRAQAFKVARLVNARGVTVRVERHCASACVLLWALARSRELDAGARIGLHRSSLPTDFPLPPAMRADLMRRNDRETDAVLRAAGFPERIVALGADTPAWSMSWFSATELQREGVPFVMRDSAAIATPGAYASSEASEARGR
ncbi:hypothetical protein ACFOED_06625 [Vulcaniibacterium thermophilum]|uniref:hypothetical protein n=1 Tax=Vulcaniibacterium thermophilum TaxID=1169913 RepID=UPI0011B6CE61|nr:hypothetical protein [Vulcaniibacterium thermophilum]